MISQRIKFTVGLFVASGICIAVAAVIWLGMSRYLEKGQYYSTYFNESVQGLDRDSPVKYRGVTIGRVHSIRVAPDAKLIEVVLNIESGKIPAHEIVAQLKIVGITGSMFIELDLKRPDEPDQSPPLSFPSEYPIVASKPSDISELLRGLDDMMKQIKGLDLRGISDKIKLTLDNANRVMAEADIQGISANMKSAFAGLEQAIGDADLKGLSDGVKGSLGRVDYILNRERWQRILGSVEKAGVALNALLLQANASLGKAEMTLDRVDGIIADKEPAVRAALEDFHFAMENANLFLKKATAVASTTDDSINHLRRYLLVTAQNIQRASENLSRLSELIADYPPQLLFGKPPQPRKVEPEQNVQ